MESDRRANLYDDPIGRAREANKKASAVTNAPRNAMIVRHRDDRSELGARQRDALLKFSNEQEGAKGKLRVSGAAKPADFDETQIAARRKFDAAQKAEKAEMDLRHASEMSKLDAKH